MFESIVGHEDVRQRLESIVAGNKISHAYIFSGKRGVGKKTVANAFADILTGGSFADIITVTNEYYGVESKSDIVSVDTVRAASADMYMKPYLADRRIFIIPDAEKMNAQAQNALLKIFEEPPSYCVIILITQNDNMLLQTIRSRAVTVRFGPLSDSLVRDYAVKNGLNSSDIMVRLAFGSIGMIRELSENEDLDGVLGDFVKIFRKIGSGTAECTYALIDYFQKEKKNSEVLFDIMLIMLRDTMLEKSSELAVEGLNKRKAVRIIELVENTRNSFSFNADYNMAVSEMLLNILGETNG